MRTPSLPARAVEIGYVTDVEGNLDYFDRWVARSGVLKYDGSQRLQLAHPQAFFVYGGDVQDRCDGSMRLTHRLVDLKRREPQRVFLIAGNRDLNKLRLTAELSAADMSRRPQEIPVPHWDPRCLSLHGYLVKVAAEKGRGASVDSVDTRVERLRWMLSHTLGCPHTFELRRREMVVLGEATEPVADSAVLESFVADIEPGGALREYLELAQLAVRLGNTLFVHGAVDRLNYDVVPLADATRFCNPAQPQPMRRVASLDEWVDGMNSVLREGLDAHRRRPYWDDDARTTRGGDVLMALQNRCAMWGRCLVSGAYVSGGCITDSRQGAGVRAAVERDVAEEHSALPYERWQSDPKDAVVAKWLLAAGVVSSHRTRSHVGDSHGRTRSHVGDSHGRTRSHVGDVPCHANQHRNALLRAASPALTTPACSIARVCMDSGA